MSGFIDALLARRLPGYQDIRRGLGRVRICPAPPSGSALGSVFYLSFIAGGGDLTFEGRIFTNNQ